MSYRRDLRDLRRVRQLASLELTAVTLHAHAQQLTIPTERLAGVPLVDTLREALHARRVLQAEAQQMLEAWQQTERIAAQ